SQLDRELTRGPRDAVHRLDHVDRDPDRPALVREAALDRLTDPPRRVGRELEAALPLELVDTAHQPGIALLDEVQQAHPAVDVLLRIRDDEPEVRRREVLTSGETGDLEDRGPLLARCCVVAGLEPAPESRQGNLVA